MHAPRPFSSAPRTRGSAFITVLLYTFLLLTLVATILDWSLNERRMNMRASYFLEARNAAEALAEYGFSQIATQYSTHATVPSFNPLGSSPLSLPPTSFFTGTDIDTTAYSTSHTTGWELIGGTAATIPTSGSLYYVDPNDPNNADDPLKGQYVYRRDVQVLARATAVPASGDLPVTAYVTEKVSVRGAPLFANAIFYSDNDLEIFPGPQMDVYGPVHCNGNMFVSNQSNSTGLRFHGAVSCSGNIYHAWASEAHAGDGAGSEALGSNPVSFFTSSGSLVAMKDSSGTWRDSTLGADSTLFSGGLYIDTTTPALTQLEAKLSSDFRTTASQVWGGNVQTAAMGVSNYNPIGTGGQVGVDGSGNAIDANTEAADSLGYGPHSMIDPPNTSLSTGDTYYDGKEEVEKQKFATKAALYVQVTVTPGTGGAADTATINVYSWPGSAPTGTPASEIGPNNGLLLGSYSTGSTPNGLLSFIPYKATEVSTGSMITNSGDPNYNKYPITTTTYSSTNSGSSIAYSTTTVSSSQVVNQGMYDQRELTGINLVQLDMSVLRAALNDTVSNSNADGKAITDSSSAVWGSGGSGGYSNEVSGSSGWNGGIYVELKTSDGSSTHTSIALANGQVASGSSLIPAVNSTTGLTIATNGPMYVAGNFNADGANATSATSATTPDDGNTDAAGGATSAEVPVALASDAITILSPGFFGTAGSNGSAASSTNGGTTNAYKSWSTAKPSAGSNTEVAAAFITGLVSTTSSASSGGAHNLPRFLENWSGDTVAIRGSLVTMYKSKVDTGSFSTRYYGAPTRNWGFDQIFQNGKFPPLTPKVMSYRRMDFSDLSATNYTTDRHTLWPSLP